MSPLTLSEVRAMLPPGLGAELADVAEREALRRLHPAARTVARILVGACSCDFLRPRHPDPLEDERPLRARFRELGLERDEVLRRLDVHRRGPRPGAPAEGWAARLAAFVGEHARNAGPTVYYLAFGSHPAAAPADTPLHRTVADVRARPSGWLEEGRPLVVG